MPFVLPDGFSEWEHLQSVLLKAHNRIVREEFSDVTDDDDITNVPRASLRHACLLKDNDTSEMTVLRMMFYWFNLRKAQDLQGHFYGVPLQDAQATRRHRPQIKLYFRENYLDPTNSDRTTISEGEIGIRLMNQTSETLTLAELTTYANRIKSVFGTPPYKWLKGKDMATYTDKERGYQLQLLVRNKTDAKELIGKVLDIQNHTPDWKYLNYKENDEPTEAYPNTPEKRTILGKLRTLPQNRPLATVSFKYATCHIHGLPNVIALYDLAGKYTSPLVE